MHELRIVALLIFCFGHLPSVHAQLLEPIDSTYLRSFAGFLRNANSLKEKAWPGMQLGPACIFRLNGPAFLLHHPLPPTSATYLGDSIYLFKQTDLALMGTSQTEINHYLTAHNNYGQVQYGSDNQFYAELFHELHHVYQRTYIKKLPFDNPAELLTYPENYRNDAIKQYENEVLLEMVTGPVGKFADNLNKFFSCRTLRQTIIGSKYATYEKRVESAEGPATYCEYQYLQAFSTTAKEQAFLNKRFYYSLVEPLYGREGLRNTFLLSGMAQCVLLSRKFTNWQPDYYASGLTLSEYFFSRFKPTLVKLPNLAYYEAKAKYFTAIEKQKHSQHLEAFNSQSGVKITMLFDKSPEFKGFDPMHAESVNDSVILHSTLLKLGKGTNYLTVANQVVATQIKGQVWFVKSVTFFLPERDIKFSKNTFECTNKNLTINWTYTKQVKEGNEYFFTVE